MRLLVAFVLSALWSSSVLCQVTITNNNPDTGGSVVASGATSATFSTPYSFAAGGAAGTAITVTPFATGDLSTATFYDGMSVSGIYVPNCFCTGALAAYLPTLRMADTFTITGSAGQIIPWSMTLTVTPQFLSASSNVFDNEIMQSFSIGGSGQTLTGYGTSQTCFASVAGGCGGAGIASPNNTPLTISFAGTISSGGHLDFIAETSGATNFVVGPGPTSVATTFALDPSFQLIVPAGVTVVSSSGVFPVTAVPEPRGDLLLLAGMAALGAFARRRAKSESR